MRCYIGQRSGKPASLKAPATDQAAYSRYNDHPDHVAFVRDRWIPEVEAFLEIDYAPLS